MNRTLKLSIELIFWITMFFLFTIVGIVAVSKVNWQIGWELVAAIFYFLCTVRSIYKIEEIWRKL